MGLWLSLQGLLQLTKKAAAPVLPLMPKTALVVLEWAGLWALPLVPFLPWGR